LIERAAAANMLGPALPTIAAAVESENSAMPTFSGPLPTKFSELCEEQIAIISFKDLTKIMAKSKMSEKQIHAAKKLRRRVKNRLSARVCINRNRSKVSTTTSINGVLSNRIGHLQRQNDTLLAQHIQLQERVIGLQKSEAQAIQEKVYHESEVERLQKLLELAIANSGSGVGAPTAVAVHEQFAIAA